MIKSIRAMTLIVTAGILTACGSYNPKGYANFQTYTYDNQPLYPETYDTGYYDDAAPRKEVVVPNSYYTGGTARPTPHTSVDKNWVNSQNPQKYTIEVANDAKASQVANKLLKAPKENRTAEVQYQRDGKTYYKGVYGTFDNMDDAQKALNALPEDVRSGASIRSWGSVQNN